METAFPQNLIIWSNSCHKELAKLSRDFHNTCYMSRYSYSKDDNDKPKPFEEKQKNKYSRSCSLHFCLHPNTHIHLWIAWKPSKIISLGNCDDVKFTSIMWGSPLTTVHIQNQWEKLWNCSLYSDYIISLWSSNSQPNWILNREQPHYLLSKKTSSC